MTETLNNFWQSFPTIAMFGTSFTEKKEVNDFLSEARRITAAADEEARYAATAHIAIQNAGNENLAQSLAVIAVWHFERAAEKYREAARVFEKAESFRVKANTREHFNRNAQEALKLAIENETAAHEIKLQNQELFQN